MSYAQYREKVDHYITMRTGAHLEQLPEVFDLRGYFDEGLTAGETARDLLETVTMFREIEQEGDIA
jgi:hypothetical protein